MNSLIHARKRPFDAVSLIWLLCPFLGQLLCPFSHNKKYFNGNSSLYVSVLIVCLLFCINIIISGCNLM
jgi:hypothetical protein